MPSLCDRVSKPSQQILHVGRSTPFQFQRDRISQCPSRNYWIASLAAQWRTEIINSVGDLLKSQKRAQALHFQRLWSFPMLNCHILCSTSNKWVPLPCVCINCMDVIVSLSFFLLPDFDSSQCDISSPWNLYWNREENSARLAMDLAGLRVCVRRRRWGWQKLFRWVSLVVSPPFLIFYTMLDFLFPVPLIFMFVVLILFCDWKKMLIEKAVGLVVTCHSVFVLWLEEDTDRKSCRVGCHLARSQSTET